MDGRRFTIPLAVLGGARFRLGGGNALPPSRARSSLVRSPRARPDPKLSEQTYGERAEESTSAHRPVAGTSIEIGSGP